MPGWRFAALLLVLAPIALELWLALALTPDDLLDDAYITLRYARNLADGHGFVYNPGEPVLGTTAPLFGMVLAGYARVAGSTHLPHAAVALGLASQLALALTLLLSGTRGARPLPRIALATALASSGILWVATLGGMETALFLMLIAGACVAVESERPVMGGLAAGLSMLCRPEGSLAVLAIALVRLPSGQRRALGRFAAAAAAPLAVYAALATVHYGSPIPLCVSAKARVFGPLAIPGTAGRVMLGEAVRQVAGLEWLEVGGMPLIGLAALALFFARGVAASHAAGDRAVLQLALFCVLYFLAHLVGNPLPAAWYAPPFATLFVAIAACGMASVLPERRGPAAAALVVLLGALSLGAVQRLHAHGIRRDPGAGSKMSAYRIACARLRSEQPGARSIATPEVGYAGWLLADWRVIDPTGLTSRVAFEVQVARGTFSYLPAELVAAARPEFLSVPDCLVGPTEQARAAGDLGYRELWRVASPPCEWSRASWLRVYGKPGR